MKQKGILVCRRACVCCRDGGCVLFCFAFIFQTALRNSLLEMNTHDRSSNFSFGHDRFASFPPPSPPALGCWVYIALITHLPICFLSALRLHPGTLFHCLSWDGMLRRGQYHPLQRPLPLHRWGGRIRWGNLPFRDRAGTPTSLVLP